MSEEKKSKQKIEQCEKEKNEYLDGWKREKADFINYKREEGEKLKKLMEINTENLIFKILPIIDNFNIACKTIPKEEIENNQSIKGLLQIKSYFLKFLKDEKVEEMECLGKLFDPFFHEAVELVDSEEESGTIIEEVEKGYLINDKLLRPAKVKIVK
jgi:molecular chaperone GrpE